MSIWTFILNHLDLNIHATIKKITLRNMLGSIPQQKFRFYHLPTRGRAGIKLGDAWYFSNVSIIFYCSMLLYYPFWMFMGFTLHFYIIFGTNLLTGGPTRIAVFFAYFSVSKKRNIKRSQNGMKPSGGIFLEQTWSTGLGVDVKEATRQHEVGGRAQGGRCRCQNRRISGRGSRSVRLRLMVIGSKGHNVYPSSGSLDGGKPYFLLD